MGDNTSKVKILIFGYKEFSQLMNSVLNEYKQVATFKIADAILVSVSEVVEQVKAFAPDVVVSAGANAAYLRSVLDIPVVSLEPILDDLIAAIEKAAMVSSDVVVINFRNASPIVPLLQDKLRINIIEEVYQTPDQARELFLVHSKPGRAFVGASYICGLATAQGYASFLVYSAQSCRSALDCALEKARDFMAYQDDKAMVYWLENQSRVPVVVFCSQTQSFTLNAAARQELRISHLNANDIAALRLATGQTCPVDGHISIDGQFWWYHLDQISTSERPYYVFQFSPKVTHPVQIEKSSVKKTNATKLAYKSKAMVTLLSQVKSYAKSPSNVLIHGESGTGKELIARQVYEVGPWSEGNFVPLNCSAIPSELFESELFGHHDGAFTGSRKGGRKGLVEEAIGGVLFLDEISELALDQQAKLLRFLQERTFRSLGSNEEKSAHFKLVAASNKSLKDMVHLGQFREDLFYRLNVFNLFIPPLRLRTDDILCIAQPKLHTLLQQYQSDCDVEQILAELGSLLIHYQWPGNIRELENVLERIVASLSAYEELSPKHAISELVNRIQVIAPELATEAPSSDEQGLVRSKELELVADAMQKFGGNKTKVAEYLGMSQTTLWRRLKMISNQHTNRSDTHGTSQNNS